MVEFYEKLYPLLQDNFLWILIVGTLAVVAILLVLIWRGGQIKVGKLVIKGGKGSKEKTRPNEVASDTSLSEDQPATPIPQPGLYGDLDSFHAITTVLALMTQNGRLIDATLKEASVFAELFYGKDTGSAQIHLVSKSSKELMEMLMPYMDSQDFEDMKEDQDKLFKAYNDGKPAHAEVPVIFNETHPYYPNGAYLPVIVSRGELKEREDGQAERLMQIAYFDVKHFEKPVQIYHENRERKNL